MCRVKRKFDFALMFLFVIATCFMVFLAVLAWVMDAKEEERQRERDQATMQIDSLRQIHKELQMRTLEDSVHYFEDGM